MGNRMVPFSDTGLTFIFRLFDVNVALCVTTAARRVAELLYIVGDVRGHKMRTGPQLKNPSTTVPRELAGLQLYQRTS